MEAERLKQLKKYTNHLFVISPFEVDYLPAVWNGSENISEIHWWMGCMNFQNDLKGKRSGRIKHGLENRPVVALLAGSRKKEIEYHSSHHGQSGF